ncbi:MAG: ATPase [Desulfobulbaceae bacterium]|uniref:ATPase n=1 Tax=Candidatus Desulfatifera sulfidica TaxID=2841691 RepID=A0A8J6NBC9_9BACT|nr:ATPase [Candidatus Desulfatifera sulfidica]
MLLADFGTSYCKLWNPELPGGPRLIASRELDPDLRVDRGTGHNGRRHCTHYVNELTALARGGMRLIKEDNYTLLDCGSRDIKFVRYSRGKVQDMGWNAECGASMGFTIELLERYYELDFSRLTVPKSSFSITCGVLGMSHIFDAVVNGSSEAEAVAKFVKGIALNAHDFAGRPETLYLSGGLCDNPLFVNSFPCQVIPLGRFVLLHGLLDPEPIENSP